MCCLTGVALSLTSCAVIDDDLDDCEVDFQASYRLHLVSNEQHELNRVLGDSLSGIANDLREHLKDVFSDYGRDFGLTGFYAMPDYAFTLPGQSPLPTEMNAVERSFEISMPVHDYMHLATVNLRGNGPVALAQEQSYRDCSLTLSSAATAAAPDTVSSQKTGLFSGRLQLTGVKYGPMNYHMDLYMVNSAAALVLDPRTAKYTSVSVFTKGFADSYTVSDSTYHFDHPTVTRAERVSLNNTNWLAFCGVSMPSPESDATRLMTLADAPFFTYEDCGKDLWQYESFVTMQDGKVTHTILTVRHPLRAGQLKIIKGFIDDQGVVRVYDANVGTTVDLDWKPGTTFEPEL